MEHNERTFGEKMSDQREEIAEESINREVKRITTRMISARKKGKGVKLSHTELEILHIYTNFGI